MTPISNSRMRAFQATVWQYYRDNGRNLPWRRDLRPYAVLVSEIMLQQTQTSRVIPKFYEFLNRFPDLESLARAPQASVVQSWQGLGYNRRARFLHQTARAVCQHHDGFIPDSPKELERLPGIGTNTAGSIVAFAYDCPVVFVETNIRSVFLHEFFPGHTSVDDREILPLVAAVLDDNHPRQWYWALMDYGVHIKQHSGNPSQRSRHYRKQSPFKTSKRRVRGEIIRQLTQEKTTFQQLTDRVSYPHLQEVLDDLEQERLITRTAGMYELAE